jgi:hypothetical protein
MDITEIKKQLPTGALRDIAKLSGVHYSAVQRFFAGNETKESLKIIDVTADYLKAYKDKRSKATEKLQAVASA